MRVMLSEDIIRRGFSVTMLVIILLMIKGAVFAQGGSAEKATPAPKSKVTTPAKSNASARRRERSAPANNNASVATRDYTFGHPMSASAGREMITVESFDSPISLDAPLILKQGRDGICAEITYQVNSFVEGAVSMNVYYRGRSVLSEESEQFIPVERGSGKRRVCQNVARDTLVHRVDVFLSRKIGGNYYSKVVLTLRIIVDNP